MTTIETPFPYQQVGGSWLASKDHALLADDMGLGKSCQAILACDHVGAHNILVICPATVRVNWEREFERFSPMDRPCKVIFTGKDTVPAGGVAVISYDLAVTMAEKLKRIEWDALILDEAHMLKERAARRTKAIYGRGSNFPGIAAKAKRVWRLSGTPAPNWANELWTHLHSAKIITDPYWDFTYRYCSGFDSNFGFQIKGHKNTEELRAILKPFMLRRKKEDVLADLPPIRYNNVTVERGPVELDPDFLEALQGKTREQFYQDLEVGNKTLKAALDSCIRRTIPTGHSSVPDDQVSILGAMSAPLTTLRRYVAMAKIEAICDILEEELKTKQIDKIVLFGLHLCVMERCRQRLVKFGAKTIYGGTPATKRMRLVDEFNQLPHRRVLIGQIVAAGTGINLTSACEVGFLEQSWVPGENAQAAMRCHRIGQDRPVRVRVFSLHNSVDEKVQDVLMRKSREIVKVY